MVLARAHSGSFQLQPQSLHSLPEDSSGTPMTVSTLVSFLALQNPLLCPVVPQVYVHILPVDSTCWGDRDPIFPGLVPSRPSLPLAWLFIPPSIVSQGYYPYTCHLCHSPHFRQGSFLMQDWHVTPSSSQSFQSSYHILSFCTVPSLACRCPATLSSHSQQQFPASGASRPSLCIGYSIQPVCFPTWSPSFCKVS